MSGLTRERSLKTLVVASAFATVLVAPLLALQLRNQGVTWGQSADYVALFGLLWALPFAYVLIAAPVAVAIQARQPLPRYVLFRTLLLLLVAAVWIGIARDQAPCFMGVPNCD